MSYRNSRGRFRSELDHGYRSGGKHSRPLERPLETFRRASYTRETTSGSDFSRFERNESFDSRYSPDRRDRYRSSYGDEYKISYRNNSADRYVESYRNRCDSFAERDDLVREDFHRRKNVGYDKPSRSRGRARGRAGFTRGVKRYTEQPYQSGMPVKKRKLSDTEINRNFKKYPQPARFRNEQQKHWKNIYGDSNWMAFSCSFCKFRSFDENSFKNHLESDWHREVLDHIKERKKFEKTMIKFLHESVVDKGKKIEACKLQSYQSEEITMATDILEGVTPQDHMEEVKSVHCNACNMDIPYLHPSVQIHIKSPKHLKNREEYRMHIKKQSVHIASNILKNPTVSARYELYLKGENPFDTQDDQVDVTVESDENAESEESDSEETAAMPTDE